MYCNYYQNHHLFLHSTLYHLSLKRISFKLNAKCYHFVTHWHHSFLNKSNSNQFLSHQNTNSIHKPGFPDFMSASLCFKTSWIFECRGSICMAYGSDGSTRPCFRQSWIHSYRSTFCNILFHIHHCPLLQFLMHRQHFETLPRYASHFRFYLVKAQTRKKEWLNAPKQYVTQHRRMGIGISIIQMCVIWSL